MLLLQRLRNRKRKRKRNDKMLCRHNLGTVNGFCVMCGKLVFIVPMKYNHKLRRIVMGVEGKKIG